MDMVNWFKYRGLNLMFPTLELFDGLLLPSVLGGSKALILRLPGKGPYSRIISLAVFGTIKPYLSANIDCVCTHIGLSPWLLPRCVLNCPKWMKSIISLSINIIIRHISSSVMKLYNKSILGRSGPVYRDAAKNLETWHLCVQWEEELPAHNHHSQQICQVTWETV